MKLNSEKAEILLNKIKELEISFFKNFNVNPSFHLLKDYLKIFICQIENPEMFLENFKKFSQGKFDLNQILKALYDQQMAQEIYQYFKDSA